jgi:hypothetical protein
MELKEYSNWGNVFGFLYCQYNEFVCGSSDPVKVHKNRLATKARGISRKKWRGPVQLESNQQPFYP